MRVCMLGSGSSGNCTYIETNETKVLVDAGFSCKKIVSKLNEINIKPEDIASILVTHEHTDHVKGAGIFSRKFDIPIYITKKSYNKSKKKLGKISENNLKYIEGNFIVQSSMIVKPFEVLHDAELTVGFSIFDKEKNKISIATDIGYATNIVKQNFIESDVAIIESNYDMNMLLNGPYPWELKNRVKSKNGHLSNVEAAKFIKDIFSDKLRKIFLAHISKDNNNYTLPYTYISNFLMESDMSVDIEIAKQDIPTTIFEI